MVQASYSLAFLPFENGALELQSATHFISFGFDERPPLGWETHLDNIVTWRPSHLKLSNAGFACYETIPESKTYDGGFLNISKHKGRNQAQFLDLLKVVKPQGIIIIYGDKNLGIQSMRKWVGKSFDIEGNLSKYHGQCFWFTRPDIINFDDFEELKAKKASFDNQFTSMPGMFSHGRIDPGSQLLVNLLPDEIKGNVADFGAGWGFLAARLLEKYAKISQLDLYEADFEALQAAKENLGSLTIDRNVNYHWFDLLKEKPSQSYDWIISNPPFHEGRASDSSIGQAFIAKAYDSLKHKGQLLLVANKQLPYEKLLSEKFFHVEKRVEQQGFKVIYARK